MKNGEKMFAFGWFRGQLGERRTRGMEFVKKTPAEKEETFRLLQKLYASEPIKPRTPAAPLPAPLQELRAMQQDPASQYETTPELFVRQGKALASYEDDTVYDLPVLHYYPTYRVLTDKELRGYFGWRTRLRHQELERTSLTYAFLYIYELLNQIGVENPQDGYEKLKAFEENYGLLDDRILPYLHQWLRDYVLYYQLDPKLLPETKRTRQDQAYLVLEDYKKASDQDLFDALDLFSTYHISRSKLYKEQPKAAVRLLGRIYRMIQAYWESHRKKPFLREHVGGPTYDWLELFANAVFLQKEDGREFKVQVDPICIYQDRKGVWTLRHYEYASQQLRKLGKLMKTLDGLLREALDFSPPLQQPLSYKWLTKLVRQAVEEDRKEQEEAEKRKVVFHLDQLDKIRRDAAVTRERLMTEEERREEILPSLTGQLEAPEQEKGSPGLQTVAPGAAASRTAPMDQSSALAGTAPASAPKAPDGAWTDRPWNLTEDEYRYLKDLLYGKDTSWAAAQGLMPSLLVDGINEKCYEAFGDTVLEAGDPPSVIEDYLEDLKGTIAP